MNDLKYWMKEVYDENRPEDDQQQDDDASEDEEDCVDSSIDDEISPTQSLSNAQVTSTYSDFDNVMISVDNSMLDAYPTPAPSFSGSSQTLQAMQQQQVQLPLQQSVIDSMSMEFEASQTAMFGSSSMLMDADLAFMDPSFSQPCDQYGPGFFDTVPYTMQ